MNIDKYKDELIEMIEASVGKYYQDRELGECEKIIRHYGRPMIRIASTSISKVGKKTKYIIGLITTTPVDDGSNIDKSIYIDINQIDDVVDILKKTKLDLIRRQKKQLNRKFKKFK